MFVFVYVCVCVGGGGVRGREDSLGTAYADGVHGCVLNPAH